jgi:hypothetical protein
MISRLYIPDILTDLDDYSGTFMAQYYRFIIGVTVTHHHIRMADTGRCILHENLGISWIVDLNCLDFKRSSGLA